MKLIVKEAAHNIHLGLPTGLLLNRITALAICAIASKHGVKISPSQMQTLIKALHQYRKTHPDWVLAEVTSAKGEYVQIKL